MNRRSFLRSSTALLATTMLCPVSGLSRNSVLMGAQRAYMQVRATNAVRVGWADHWERIRIALEAERVRDIAEEKALILGPPAPGSTVEFGPHCVKL